MNTNGVSQAVSHMRRARFLLALAVFLLLMSGAAAAQEEETDGLYYIVQEGDSLWDIAVRFGVPLDELQRANGIADSNQIDIGARLLIPGLGDFSGRVDTQVIPYGENLRSLSRSYQVPEEILIQLNRLVSPAELFAGETVVVPAETIPESRKMRTRLVSEQTLLELAVLNNTDPWTILAANDLPGAWGVLPGDVLQMPGKEQAGSEAFFERIQQIALDPLVLSQGDTLVIRVTTVEGIPITGTLFESELRFFPFQGETVALQGIPAMIEPGLYPLTTAVGGANGEQFVFSQAVLIRDASYAYDPVLNVDPETLDPAVTRPENELWRKLGIPVTPEKMWQGRFESPVPVEFKDCWTSLFGNRRSYNGGPYNAYHSGLDFCGTTGTELYAPAAGTVVFAGPLTVRGNATVIDHGWGVYTAYDHQSEIYVRPGDRVESGQLIGLGGDTGRTTGPHLHWEVWVGGVQVDPADWLERVFP